MALYFDDEEYDLQVDDKQSEFYNIINKEKFNNLPAVLISRSDGRTKIIDSLIKDLKGTYFELLPVEILHMIFKKEFEMEILEQMWYYAHSYFAYHETSVEVERILRPTVKQQKLLQLGEVTGLYGIDNGDGTITYGRPIWKNNIANEITKKFNDMFKIFEKSPGKGIKRLYKIIKSYMVWICHHSYIYEWESLMMTIYSKCNVFWIRFSNYKVDIKKENFPPEFNNYEEFDTIWNIMNEIKYFLDHYLPYRLFSESDMFYDTVDLYLSSSHILNLLYEIYNITNVHPNDINIQKVQEFEMKMYASKYYNNIYSKYLILRNGKRIIPDGKYPQFYWSCGKYIKRFI